MYQSVKTKRTLYTDKKIQNMHKNIQLFSWAKEKAEKVIARADRYLAHGIDRLTSMLPAQNIGRSFDVSQEHGCPHCGMEMMRYGNVGWKYDFIEHPWKVICPNCGRMYPSNDFGAFYESGLDEHGLFSYDRADRSLLVNELYPEMGPDFAVDDGRGWLIDASDPEHNRFTFIAHYIGCCVWAYDWEKLAEYCVVGIIPTLCEAYMITGDRKYANPAAQLYYRMALLYPTLDISAYPWTDGYKQAHGHTGLGRFCGCINDTFVMKSAVEWYDMLYDCLDDTLAAYLRENPVRYIGKVPESGEQIRNEIEENMLMRMYPDLRDYTLHCNPGPPQALILKTARILEQDDLFDECAEFIFKYIDHVRTAQHYMDLESLLLSEVDRDGFGGEVSPGYNGMWIEGYIEAAMLLKGHKYDLFENIKFRKIGNMAANYVVADRYTLPVADADKCGNPAVYLLRNPQVLFFLETGNVESAQLLVQEFGDGPICTDWYLDCEAVDKLIRDTAAKAGKFASKSRCFAGFGLASMAAHHEGKDPESVAMFFGRNGGHGHRDTLNLYLHGFGIDLMPDHGYPNFADPNAERYRWTSNYISHNTIALKQKERFPEKNLTEPKWFPNINRECKGGKIHHYYTDGALSVIEADAANTFNHEMVDFKTDRHRRTVITVDLDGKSRYVVDLFSCGAAESHLSYHAIGTETEVRGAEFTAQAGGTYAGETIPYADYDYSHLWADGFNYLTDVRRSKTPGQFTVDWKCVDNWHVWEKERDVHLKIHMLSDVAEASLCTGMPPQAQHGNPKAMTYLIAKCDGPAEYVSVIEPYEDAPFLAECSVLRHDEDATILCVKHTSGAADYIGISRSGELLDLNGCIVSGFVNVLRYDALDMPESCHIYGEQQLVGSVVDFTKELTDDNWVTVQLAGATDPSQLIGKFIDIETDAEPNAFFEITDAKPSVNGEWKLCVGDCTFVTGFVDRDEKEDGYTYVIKRGAACAIMV